LRVKRYTHNFNNRTNAVWLSFLQRRLLNMELPVILSPAVQAHLKHAADEDQYQYFISKYHPNANGELKLEKMDEETHARMKRIFATVSSTVELRQVNDCEVPFKSQPEILSRCIGNASIMLRSVRCTENDEILDSIMLTATNLKRLGISDGDKATVSYRGRHLTVRVHELRHDSFQNVIRNNNLDSPDDIDMVACMPVVLRFRLGLSDINDCVTIERNLPYIVRKNITEQLLALIGLFIALTGIPGVSFMGSFIAFLALAPLVLYSIFSKEREKI
ncbi:MAG: hypothetical protein K2M12_09235, partial [Muribaculaceae bacterium]|nr:hypothetical protein [Muribaculaceae bacterium]